MRGKAEEATPQGALGAPLLREEPQRPVCVRRTGAVMINRVYEVNPLICPKCSAQMAIVSFIEDVILAILSHLGLLVEVPQRAPPQIPRTIESDVHYQPLPA